MAQTVIGLFDSEKEAQQAVQQLFDDGFTDAQVDINTRAVDNDRVRDDYKASNNENGFVKFFNNLFGTDDEADKYSKVAERSSSIVTVHADSQDEAERAADILDLYGAVDVDQKASEFGYNYNSRQDFSADRSTFPVDRQNFASDSGNNLDFDRSNYSNRTNNVDLSGERYSTQTTNEFDPNYSEGDVSRRASMEKENNFEADPNLVRDNFSSNPLEGNFNRGNSLENDSNRVEADQMDKTNNELSDERYSTQRINEFDPNYLEGDISRRASMENMNNFEADPNVVRNDFSSNSIEENFDKGNSLENESNRFEMDQMDTTHSNDRRDFMVGDQVDLTPSHHPSNEFVDNDQRPIPVIEENINIQKREVETGGVRLRSRIIEKPVEESLRLRQERVRVERNAVNREATEADFRNFQEGEIELTERGEIPVISKDARVVEEVRLRKDVEDRSETVRDTVRKTEVDVEDFRNDEELKRRDNI